MRSVYRCVIFVAILFGIGSSSLRDFFSEIRQGQRETLLSVAVRACMDLCLFFAPARVYAHELGNLLRRVRV